MKFIQTAQQRFTVIKGIPFIQSNSDWRYLIGAGVLILLAGIINYDTRQDQWEYWQENPSIFYADDQPLVSSADAGYFLSYAHNYQEGEVVDRFHASRHYPDLNTDRPITTIDYPLLSVALAKISTLFFDGDLLTAGNAMIPIAGFFTAVMVGIMFWMAGYPAEGAIAGTGFGLSSIYLVRTSVGRIDTDQLVMFFVALIISFILLAMRQSDYRRMMGFVLLASISSLVFWWWYPKSIFIAIFPIITGLGIYMTRRDWRLAALGFAVFVLVLNPVRFFKSVPHSIEVFISFLFKTDSTSPTGFTGLQFPNTNNTITELQRVDFFATLNIMTPHVVMGLIGCLGFVAFTILRPSRGLVFLPFFVLGILSVMLGQRFAFYGAPFVWFGLAWLFVSFSRIVSESLTRRYVAQNPNSFAHNGTVLALSGIALIFTALVSNTHYIPRPNFSSPVVQTLAEIKGLERDNNGVLATWWDYGYMAHFKSGMDTFHDGGAQRSPRTHLIARGLISRNTEHLIQIIKFIGTEGNPGIQKYSKSLDDLNLAISKAGMPNKTPYLLVTNEMQDWLPTIAQLGLFNPITGTYPSSQVANSYYFQNLTCMPIQGTRFQCEEGVIDLRDGTLNERPVITNSVVSLDGRIERQLTYNNDGRYVLLMSRNSTNNELRLKLVSLLAWESAFNQLFELGVYDEDRLELVIDNFPHARVYRILH